MLYYFMFFSRKKSKSRKKGEKSEDKDKIALQIKQVKIGINNRERREKTLTDHRNSVWPPRKNANILFST